jgi:hypothetical protein
MFSFARRGAKFGAEVSEIGEVRKSGKPLLCDDFTRLAWNTVCSNADVDGGANCNV